MRRNALIAHTLATSSLNASVLLISGSRESNAMLMHGRVDCLTLPSLRKDSSGVYQPRHLPISRDDLVALRATTIEAALRAFAPDLLVVDKLPRGVFGELDASLESLREVGTKCVLGLRDVLDDPETVEREWSETDSEKALAEYYSAVWIYGDPTVYDMLYEYRLSHRTAEKVRYTGYLDASVRTRMISPSDVADDIPDGRIILCQVGGGEDGGHLAFAFANAKLTRGTTGVILTGPFMPKAERDALQHIAARRNDLRVLAFSAEPARLLARAERVVAMGGYNTVCEIISMGKAALIVPRTQPRVEQLIRAERFRDLGVVDVLTPDEISPVALSEWLRCESVAPTGVRELVDFNGIDRLPHLAREVLAAA